jgi:NAD(P)-dependent dehydrogenase (short-subunit alcohol dehydrogenase family)
MTAAFSGRVTLITGAARGQGATEAELFARAGSAVIITDVLDDAGEATAAALRESGLRTAYRHLDVSSADDWKSVVEFADAEFGRIDVLVNNAGIVTFDGVGDTSDEDWQRAIAINQTGVFNGMRAVMPSMRRGGAGSIVNISSVFGLTGVPGYFAYQASKGAVVQMTRAAAVDLADLRIRVNCVCPGLIFTDMTKTEPKDMIEANIRMTPLQRGGEPSEVARAVLFLASDDASYITGAVVPVDGGYTTQ